MRVAWWSRRPLAGRRRGRSPDDLRSRATPDVLRALVRGIEPLLPPGRAGLALHLAERGRLVEGFESLCDELCARGPAR